MRQLHSLSFFCILLLVSLQSLLAKTPTSSSWPPSSNQWDDGCYDTYGHALRYSYEAIPRFYRLMGYNKQNFDSSYMNRGYNLESNKEGLDQGEVRSTPMSEYCCFLRENVNARTSSSSDFTSYFFPNPFFDHNFMAEEGQKDPLAGSRPAAISYNPNGSEIWTILPGHKKDIIDSTGSYYVYNELRLWRTNPTAKELRKYANNKVQGDEDGAQQIKGLYEASTTRIFDLVDQAIEVAQDPSKEQNVTSSSPSNETEVSADQISNWTEEYNFADVLSFRKMTDGSLKVLLNKKRDPWSRPEPSYYEGETHNGEHIFK